MPFRSLFITTNINPTFTYSVDSYDPCTARIRREIPLHPEFTDEIANQNKLLIVRPPEFLTNDVEEGLLDDLLNTCESEHCKALQRCIDGISGGPITRRLNSLLNHAKFYEKVPWF